MENALELFFWSIIIGLLPAFIAQNKGRSFIGFWVYGALLFIVALPHALLMSPNIAVLENKSLALGGKRCPFCAEIIKKEAIVCRYCSKDQAITPTIQNEIKITHIDTDTQKYRLPDNFLSKIIVLTFALAVVFVLFRSAAPNY